MKRFLIMIIGTISLYVIVYPFFLFLLGYYPWGVSWDVAQKIVEKGGTVADCKKIIHPIADPMSPTQGEQRAGCIYDVAKLTKDPSACELLMPSSYGLDCVGAAEDFDPCIMLADDKKTVKGQGLETTYDSCQNGPNVKHVCCSMARVLYSDERNCGNFPQGELRDQCHHIVGVRMKKIEECALIENERNKIGCEVVVRAYLTGRL